MKAELEEGFESFAAATAERWYRLAYAITRDHEPADEAVRNALAAAYAGWRRVHNDPEPYVRRVLVHDILGWSRRRASPTQPHDAVRIRRRADRDLADTDTVWQALLELPVGQRALIVLRYYERLSEDQVARTLAIRSDLVRTQTGAALDDLRRQMTLARQRARA